MQKICLLKCLFHNSIVWHSDYPPQWAQFLFVVVRKLLLRQLFPTLPVCTWQLLKNSSPQEICRQLRNPGTAVQTQKTKTDSKRIRLFCSGGGKGLKSNVSKDAIHIDQREQLVQIPWSHNRGGKNTTTEFTTASRSMELTPMSTFIYLSSMSGQKGGEGLWELEYNFLFSGAASSPEVHLIHLVDCRFTRRGMGSCISQKHMEVVIEHAPHHGRQNIPHFQLLPNHHIALSSALSLSLIPGAEVIVYIWF